MHSSPRIPVTLLSGFLGAGKTTLLNRLLAGAGARRIAVVENEFGARGVDQVLVEGADQALFELNDGCLCCTVLDDLVRVLERLQDRRADFDHLVIEATGLADPGPVIAGLSSDGIREHYELAGIVTLVDARHVERDLEETEVCGRQIAMADLLILNKMDLVSSFELTALQARLAGLNSLARCIPTVRARIPRNAVLANHRAGLPTEPTQTHHHHDDAIRSVSVDLPGDVDIQALDRWLGDLVRRQDVLRMKGLVAVPGDPRRFVFQGVRRWIDVRPHGAWGDEPRRNLLVFIGRGLDETQLRGGVEACLEAQP